MLLPSCRFSPERVSVALENLKITAGQEQLLADIAETLIPETDRPGARNLNVHQFVMVMIDDCRSAEDQELFQEGLQRIDPVSNHFFGSSFSESTLSQREELLAGVLDQQREYQSYLGSDYDRFREFLFLVKRYTIQGFLQSQYVLTEVFPYIMAPGYFDGCEPVGRQS